MNYERLVRQIRQRIFKYDEESEAKGEKATRILHKALSRIPKRQLPIDQWGATAEDRSMLGGHGICWHD